MRNGGPIAHAITATKFTLFAYFCINGAFSLAEIINDVSAHTTQVDSSYETHNV